MELKTLFLSKHINMKIILAILLCSSFLASHVQAQEKITIPKGIVYKYCDPKIVEKAKLLITTNLTDSTKYDLCDNILIIGPVLWNRFKNIDILNKIEGGNTTFHVDKDELSGKMTQDNADTKKVWTELRKEINGEKFIIRKLNEKELQYYWAVISFDIDEPLLVVETSSHKYILNILKDSLKLMWLDEVPK
jgi:hypothetical protein